MDVADTEDDEPTISDWWRRHFGVVRLRQIADDIRHRLSFIPIVYVCGSIVFVEFMLWIDRSLADISLPSFLQTTVTSAQALFAAIAGGLITSITLLLSMMLVAVQLASTQFSPRTLRDWLGNRSLQHAVGFVLGTTVFCLLGLRSTRDFGDEGGQLIPHLTVLVAVALGVLSLVAVVRTVDTITHSLQVGSVAKRLATETVRVIARTSTSPTGEVPEVVTASGALDADGMFHVPAHAMVVQAPKAGWVQQIDEEDIFRALPDGATAYVVADLGQFLVAHAPLMWVNPTPAEPSECRARLIDAFALGESRTMQQDAEFGVIQLTDIAVRALSPGINDPTTASDIIVNLGAVLLASWEHPEPEQTRRLHGRTLVRHRRRRVDLLDRAFGPIRRYGAADPEVMSTLVATCAMLASEVERRRLPGDIAPLRRVVSETDHAADRSAWTRDEIGRFDALVADSLT